MFTSATERTTTSKGIILLAPSLTAGISHAQVLHQQSLLSGNTYFNADDRPNEYELSALAKGLTQTSPSSVLILSSTTSSNTSPNFWIVGITIK